MFTKRAIFVIRQARLSRCYSFPPHTVVKMPALSPTMTQGNLGQWHKQIGEELSPGDILVEIETDKAQMDMECQDEGFLAKVLIQSGAKDVLVNTPMCVLAENKEDVDKFANFVPQETASVPVSAPAAVDSAPAKSSTPTPSAPAAKVTESEPVSSGRVIASPVAKQLALEKGIPLSLIKGTGPDGRIIKEDVIAYKPAEKKATLATPTATTSESFIDTPLTNIRKVIASRLTESKSQVPHYYMTMSLEVSKLLKLRQVLNTQSNGKYKLSVNDFIIKASSLALVDVPALNSQWGGDFIRQYKSADIAVAVATETGLITPIIHSAQGKGLAAISNTVKNLAEKGRAGKLQPHEYQVLFCNLGWYLYHFKSGNVWSKSLYCYY
jgi:pyruvate dehydrogenase E2 component (dihydrolipoamide acetyltransferase)